jgi:hypothetical protein
VIKGDIVEALQSLKCSLHNDLLFHEAGPSSLVEEEFNDSDTEADTILEKEGDVADDKQGWDTFILDDENNSDDDMSVSEMSDY